MAKRTVKRTVKRAPKRATSKVSKAKQKELDEAIVKQRNLNRAMAKEAANLVDAQRVENQQAKIPSIEESMSNAMLDSIFKTDLEKLQEERKALEEDYQRNANAIARSKRDIDLLSKDIEHLAIECASIDEQVEDVSNKIKMFLVNQTN